MAPKSFRVEAVLPAPAPTYFLERDSAAFRSLLSKVLKIGQLEFNDLWHEGASSFVRMVTKPEFGSWVPKSVAGQLQSSNLEFHDIIEYNPAHIATAPYCIFVRTESPFLKDKLDIQLTLTIEEVDPGVSCRQILEGHIRVKMFGVGRIVEGIVKDSLINTYKKLPEIVRRWQLFREEALRSGDGRQLLLGRPPVGCEVSWIRREVLEIMKEPLPEDGTASPVSALCPVAGASEASEDSPAALARAQQRAMVQQQQQQRAAAEAEAVFAAAAAAVAVKEQQPQAAAVERQQEERQALGVVSSEEHTGGTVSTVSEEALMEDLRQARRHSAAISEYYDAREVVGGDDEVCSAPQPGAELQQEALPPQQQQQQQEAPPQQGLPPLPPAEHAAAASLPSSPPHTHRSLASLAAAALARGAHHRRGLSTDSATSTDTPTTEGGQARAPDSRRFWRRFNRNYLEWGVYWDQVGVEQEVQQAEEQEAAAAAGAGGGIVARALYAVEDLMRDSYYSTSILVALFLMRRGWLRVEPDANAPTHDEEHRQHAGHRHRRTPSSGGASVASELWPAAAAPQQQQAQAHQVQAQSLARVAQEVCSRMVSGPRKAVTAAGNGLVAAGSSVRQASVTGAKAIFNPASRPRSSAGGVHTQAPYFAGAAGPGSTATASGAYAYSLPPRHRKTMSLDTGTAAHAREVAAVALQQQEQQQAASRGAAGQHDAAPAPPLPASWSPSKPLERRPSDMASAAAMASMQRTEHRVRAPSRLACFGGCRRPPAVKD